MPGLDDVKFAADALFGIFGDFWSFLLSAGVVGMALIMVGLMRRILRLMDKFRR